MLLLQRQELHTLVWASGNNCLCMMKWWNDPHLHDLQYAPKPGEPLALPPGIQADPRQDLWVCYRKNGRFITQSLPCMSSKSQKKQTTMFIFLFLKKYGLIWSVSLALGGLQPFDVHVKTDILKCISPINASMLKQPFLNFHVTICQPHLYV